LGYTVYYQLEIEEWKAFANFVRRVISGIGWDFQEDCKGIVVLPPCEGVEPLILRRNYRGFAKTNMREPCHSIYLLILYSASSFGSVSVLED
jgi:hypothetical protein